MGVALRRRLPEDLPDLLAVLQRTRRAGRLPVLEIDLLSPALPFCRRRGWCEVGTVAQQ